MDEYNNRLGVGLIPTENQITQIYSLAQDIADNYDLSFYIKPGISIPHITFFQGRFKSEEEVIMQIKDLDLSYLNRIQPIQRLSVWARKILFLDCKKSEDLKRAHESVYNVLFPLCERKSADTQKFEGITEGQQKSFDETGYPFSLDEYLPHFTIAHLKNPMQELKPSLQEIFKRSGLSNDVNFNNIVVYRAGDLGRCVDFAYKKSLH